MSVARFRTTQSGPTTCCMKRLWQRLVPDGRWERFVQWLMSDGVTHHERPDSNSGSAERMPSSWEPPVRGKF